MEPPRDKNQSAGDIPLLETLRSNYQSDPDDMQTAARLAEHYADLGWYNEALAVYRTALKNHGEDFFLVLGYGNTCYRHQDKKEALQAFKKLTTLRPERIEGWNNAGIVLMDLGHLEEAKAMFERVLAIEPDNAGALLNLGNYHADKGNARTAIGLFERAIETRPDFADAWFNLGNTHLVLKDYDAARNAFERAVRYRREFPSALKNLGFVYEHLGNGGKAVEQYRAAAGIAPVDATIQINLANALLGLGQSDEAKNCFLKAVRLAPKNTAGWLGLRHIALLKGDLPTYLRATLAIMPHLSGDVLAQSVDALLEHNHFDGAAEIVRSADSCNKESDELDAMRLVVYGRQKNNPGRQTALYRRLSMLPSPSDFILKALGMFTFETRDMTAALGYLQMMRKTDPGSAYLLIACLIALDKTDAARMKLDEALKRWPSSGSLLFLDARLAAGAKDMDRARTSLLAALDCGFDALDEIKKDPALSGLLATFISSPDAPAQDG
ncbi:MAG: tetratricopeptide repeat protein [Chitinispirillaceae bacterium]|nr:tetratricopeptide repeat protein [Chitinispirillaceae bacterium]